LIDADLYSFLVPLRIRKVPVVFTHIPRTGEPVGNPKTSIATRAAAIIGVTALTAGLSLVAAAPASADEVTPSYAQGQFLSGTIAGSDLATVAALAAAQARNNGQQPLQTSKDPLNASVLQTVNVQSPNGIQTDLGSFLDAGAVGQYAQADKNGQSMGSAGAVGNDGAIGVGAVGSGSSGNLSFDLNSLLQGQFSSAITDLKLKLDAVSAQATANMDVAAGDYRIDGATLTFTSPAISGLKSKVDAALAPIDTQLAGLGGANGPLGTAVNGILDPLLAAVGSSATVSASVTSDVHSAVDALLTSAYGNNAVKFDLETGQVTVDLAALQGGSLNNLPVNTELLSDGVMNQVLKGITDTVSTLADQIVAKVTTSLNNAQVNVHAGLDVLTAQPPVVNQVCHDVQVPIIGDLLNSATGGLNGLLGNLTGGAATVPVQGIIGYTTQTVCDLVNTVLPDLHSTANVDVQGTVDQILKGVAATATGSISLLNGTVNVPLDINGILGGLSTSLTNNLFSSSGAVSKVTDALNSGLVNPAVSGLLGNTSVQTALTGILSVRVNLQELTPASQQGNAVAAGNLFTETAVRVSALKGVGSTGLATVNVAAATVGPNVTTVIPGCTTNCGPPACTTNCGPGGNPNPPVTTTAAGRLAMTGVGIATLVAIILALLAAGAYLAREGYRRNHPHSLT
jgi:hypothetical protein